MEPSDRVRLPQQDDQHRQEEFLALLGHELRNPLTPICNALAILRQSDLPSETRARAQDMAERQTRHLTRLVDDLLDLSRSLHGRIELRKETVKLAELIGHAAATMGPEIQERRHQLRLPDLDAPYWVEADPVRLEQIVANLLTNAVRFTPPGGQIDLLLEGTSDEVIVRVRDTGIGIAPELLPRVFDLFWQAQHWLERSGGGLGIGLTLVRRLVELHGGRVSAFSAGLGHGSELVVRLPRAAAPCAGADDVPQPTEQGAARRILVVDDNEDAALSLSILLGLQGHEVQVAHDGLAALQATETFHPEIVLLDIGMPKMNGYEVVKHMRRQTSLADILILAVSGFIQSESHGRDEAGFDHQLVKPLDLDVLFQIIAEQA
jgi:CheY-like chemotaxis protein